MISELKPESAHKKAKIHHKNLASEKRRKQKAQSFAKIISEVDAVINFLT